LASFEKPSAYSLGREKRSSASLSPAAFAFSVNVLRAAPGIKDRYIIMKLDPTTFTSTTPPYSWLTRPPSIGDGATSSGANLASMLAVRNFSA
jgi:hypothetical protein